MTSADGPGTALTDSPGQGVSSTVSKAKDVVIARVRTLRGERGWSAAALASRCAELGAPEMTTNVIRNLESRARGVSVEQLLIFALALDVPPAYLLTPADPQPGNENPDAPESSGIAITDTVAVADAGAMNRWVSGTQPLPQTSQETYRRAAAEHRPQVGEEPSDSSGRMLEQFERQAERFVSNVRDDVTRLLDDATQQIVAARDPDAAVAALQQARRRVAP
jgi:transcriptional regulator with XRE-family HTH domain